MEFRDQLELDRTPGAGGSSVRMPSGIVRFETEVTCHFPAYVGLGTPAAFHGFGDRYPQ